MSETMQEDLAKPSVLYTYKSEAVAARGMLATKHPLASAAGVEMLEAGGNAVDAAVAACLAVSVVEPAMSGIGGGGYMTIASGGAVKAVAFPMRASGSASAEMYRLTGRSAVGNFGWDEVEGDANLMGSLSIAVPGAVAGLSLALAEFGTMSWAEVCAPAIALARDGFQIDWHDAFVFAMNAERVVGNEEAARVFLPNGQTPKGDGVNPGWFKQPQLAATLQALADAGPADFYKGDVGREIITGIERVGGILTLEDFARYEARVREPLSASYRDVIVNVPPFACAGPTTVQTLNVYDRFDAAGMGHMSSERLHAYICAAKLAFADRFEYMADPEFVDVPWEGLVSPDYAAERSEAVAAGRVTPPEFTPGDPLRFQTGIGAMGGGKGAGASGSTTHLCAADDQGNFVSLTNTLMAGFGSGVVPEGTGVVMNNGMMWFDPVPGRPNSIAPFKQGLNNMTPAIVTRGGAPYLAVGASGGRRITNAVTQIMSNVIDHGMGVQEAIAAPRVDCSTEWISVDDRFSPEVIEDLQRRGHVMRLLTQAYSAGFALFASPTAILWDEDQRVLRGGVDVFHGAEARGL
ncbi:MAG: gamma-glutamyltransferase [Chloroflexi bacterium]|nr:gamma-glutamyltransferase [Chloroflexota bacterium]